MPSRQHTGHEPVRSAPEDAPSHPAVAAFASELRHWREVTGCSQKALAKLVGYTPPTSARSRADLC